MSQPPFSAVLLDTCALIWLATGGHLAAAALEVISFAGNADGLYVSTISAWEIGLLSQARGRNRPGLTFRPDAKAWFAQVMARPAIKGAPLTADIAVDASHLPGDIHGDPGDRLLIATARHLAMPIVTRDRKIIDYGRAGFVDVVPC